MKNKSSFFRAACLLFAVLIILPCFAIPAKAETPEARMTESIISDWTYDAYYQIIKYSYDKNGQLVKTICQHYGDDQFETIWYESETAYEYYDNGMERMRFGQGWEKHFDRYGTVIDSPKPAAPDAAFLVWYEDTIQHYYDLNGNLTRLEADDTVYEYKYDDSDRILEVKSSDPFDYQLTFTYEQNGGYTLHAESSGWDDSYLEKYDYDGRVLQSSRSGESTYEYSADGNTVREISSWVDFDGNKISTTRETRRSYDGKGQLQNEETWEIADSGEELQERKLYEYDSNGNLVHLQVFWYSGTFSPPMLVREERHTFSH